MKAFNFYWCVFSYYTRLILTSHHPSVSKVSNEILNHAKKLLEVSWFSLSIHLFSLLLCSLFLVLILLFFSETGLFTAQLYRQYSHIINPFHGKLCTWLGSLSRKIDTIRGINLQGNYTKMVAVKKQSTNKTASSSTNCTSCIMLHYKHRLVNSRMESSSSFIVSFCTDRYKI